MAEAKTAKKTIYNHSDGPRSIMTADGSAVVIGPGEGADVELSSGELENIHPDLSTSKPKEKPAPESASAAVGADQVATLTAKAVEELATAIKAGNDDAALAKMAEAEKVKVDEKATGEQIALAIAQKRLGVKPVE